jgi:hypothetical protein
MLQNPPAPTPFAGIEVTKLLQYRETPTDSNVVCNSSSTFSLIFVIDRPNRKV